MRNESIEATGANGRLLRVEFVWRGDRFGQLISVVEASGQIHSMLESVEGTPTDDWPPSPPLQGVVVETRPDGRRVALLVGMAGGSHWSASVEAPSGVAELIFDLACRHAKSPVWLGSRYRRLAGGEEWTLSISGDAAQVTHAGATISVGPHSVAGVGTTRWRFSVRTDL